MLTDYGFVLLNYFSWMFKSSPPLLLRLHRWQVGTSPVHFSWRVFNLLVGPTCNFWFTRFSRQVLFFSSQPSQNTRPKELQASVQDIQRPHSLASTPTICARTVRTSDALGMCGTHCIGNMEHICTYFHPKSYITHPRYFPFFPAWG